VSFLARSGLKGKIAQNFVDGKLITLTVVAAKKNFLCYNFNMKNYKKTIGGFGENLAKNFLIRRGYKIIANNVKIGHCELDLVASCKKELIFVEVKTLSSEKIGPANEALKSRQIKNLKKAMSIYCWQQRHDPEKARFDFISIDLNRAAKTAKIKHYQNIL
jgi:putative endonuclease